MALELKHLTGDQKEELKKHLKEFYKDGAPPDIHAETTTADTLEADMKNVILAKENEKNAVKNNAAFYDIKAGLPLSTGKAEEARLDKEINDKKALLEKCKKLYTPEVVSGFTDQQRVNKKITDKENDLNFIKSKRGELNQAMSQQEFRKAINAFSSLQAGVNVPSSLVFILEWIANILQDNNPINVKIQCLSEALEAAEKQCHKDLIALKALEFDDKGNFKDKEKGEKALEGTTVKPIVSDNPGVTTTPITGVPAPAPAPIADDTSSVAMAVKGAGASAAKGAAPAATDLRAGVPPVSCSSSLAAFHAAAAAGTSDIYGAKVGLAHPDPHVSSSIKTF